MSNAAVASIDAIATARGFLFACTLATRLTIWEIADVVPCPVPGPGVHAAAVLPTSRSAWRLPAVWILTDTILDHFWTYFDVFGVFLGFKKCWKIRRYWVIKTVPSGAASPDLLAPFESALDAFWSVSGLPNLHLDRF